MTRQQVGNILFWTPISAMLVVVAVVVLVALAMAFYCAPLLMSAWLLSCLSMWIGFYLKEMK